MDKEEKSAKQEISISLDPETEKGLYCNLAVIAHSNTEFVFDFVFHAQGKGQVVSRIITNPQHAKAIANALNENIKKYEAQFGEMSSPAPDVAPIIRH